MNTTNFTVEEVQEIFLNKGYRPLFNTYKNAKEKLKFTNEEGYICIICLDKLKQGRKAQPFSILNPYTIENIKTFIIKNNRHDELLSNEFIGGKKNYLKFKCEKGHVYSILWKHYKNNHGCPYCDKSRGEFIIESYLVNKNIKFEQQKKYNDLVASSKRKLSYDFYLPKYEMFIEYQGEQHYRPIEYFGGEEKFKIQKYHDKLKKEYAKQNNIKLLEVPYWCYDNIEEVLNKELINIK